MNYYSTNLIHDADGSGQIPSLVYDMGVRMSQDPSWPEEGVSYQKVRMWVCVYERVRERETEREREREREKERERIQIVIVRLLGVRSYVRSCIKQLDYRRLLLDRACGL